MKILKSLVIIGVVAALTISATGAIFTSQAKVTGNTFATGTLEIRINGQASIPGFNVTNAAPGDTYNGNFNIQNWNAAQFGGNSTLPAKSLKLSAVRTSVPTVPADLWDVLKVKVDSTVGWNNVTVYDGKLKNLMNKEILLPGNEFPAGWTMPMSYTVTLPSSAGNEYQGLSATFDFVVDASSS